MTPIENYDSYNQKMNKSMLDKLFFLSHVDADIFVDFGCADGAMIRAMSKTFPDSIYIGYDNDPKMIEKAKWLQESHRNIFLSDWKELEKELEACKSWYSRKPKTCLILSSVIHEIYSYGNVEEIKTFWDRVFEYGFDYVAIRDMALRPFNISHYPSSAELSNVIEKFDKQQVKDFEEIWGKFDALDQRKVIHFLLKYKYTENWEREVRENYFSYNIDNVIQIAYDANYRSSYFDHFSVPFIRRQIYEDFGFVMNEPTHYKLILEKNFD